MMQAQDLTGEIVFLNKESRTGRFRCEDGTEINFVIAPGLDPQPTYELFAKKNVSIGGFSLGASNMAHALLDSSTEDPTSISRRKEGSTDLMNDQKGKVEQYWTVEHVMERLHCSEVSVRRWMKQGRLEKTLAGTKVLVSESALQRFLAHSTTFHQ